MGVGRGSEAVCENAEQVDERAGVVEEGVGGEVALGDVVGVSTDQFFEFAGVVAGDGEEVPDEEEVKELLLDFGVHEYLVGHV